MIASRSDSVAGLTHAGWFAGVPTTMRVVQRERLESELLVERAACRRGEQGDGRCAGDSEHVAHQRSAMTAAAVRRVDEHHPDRCERRREAGEGDRSDQPASVRIVEAVHVADLEQERKPALLVVPVQARRKGNEVGQVVNAQPPDPHAVAHDGEPNVPASVLDLGMWSGHEDDLAHCRPGLDRAVRIGGVGERERRVQSVPWSRAAVGWARLRRLPSCIACTLLTGISWPSATRSSLSCCGDGIISDHGSRPASRSMRGEHRVLGRVDVVEVVPRHGERHGQPGPRPRAVGRNDGCAADTGRVDEHLAFALVLHERRGGDARVDRLGASRDRTGRRGRIVHRRRVDRPPGRRCARPWRRWS